MVVGGCGAGGRGLGVGGWRELLWIGGLWLCLWWSVLCCACVLAAGSRRCLGGRCLRGVRRHCCARGTLALCDDDIVCAAGGTTLVLVRDLDCSG